MNHNILKLIAFGLAMLIQAEAIAQTHAATQWDSFQPWIGRNGNRPIFLKNVSSESQILSVDDTGGLERLQIIPKSFLSSNILIRTYFIPDGVVVVSKKRRGSDDVSLHHIARDTVTKISRDGVDADHECISANGERLSFASEGKQVVYDLKKKTSKLPFPTSGSIGVHF